MIPPPLPDLHVYKEAANSLALALSVEINRVLVVAHDIALGKDFKQFLKVVAVLWGLSVVGGWFHFLTLLYLAIIAAHTIPVVYETYEDQIEHFAAWILADKEKRARIHGGCCREEKEMRGRLQVKELEGLCKQEESNPWWAAVVVCVKM